MDNMQTQIDHNAYSALFSDSEESEAGELSALLADPDLDADRALSRSTSAAGSTTSVEHGPPTSRKLKLKYSDVQEVLKYRPDT